MKLRLATTLLLVLASFAVRADSDGHPLSMWQIDGAQNRVYLLGSVHLLRENDHPLPSTIYTAYGDAEKLIMELDMDDLDPVEAQKLSNELGLLHDDRSLSDLLGPALYAEAERLAVAAEVPLALLAKAKPWYAAMNVEIMMLMRMGFNPAWGIESHLMERAIADNKEILGFETMRQQLEFLDGMSAQAQNEMLLQALAESGELGNMMDSMIDAWRTGDTEYMERNLLSDMADFPELNEVIVVSRNISWTDQIEELLEDEDDYLIVVGTLHLVGDNGVPDLLAERGHDVRQMHQAAN